mmetsp:Transcript_55937/g.155982  ORF Transcript_55937/g.155982 Transcript_55937/m.155982 type:complete len:119 (-) Transcript_55937:260-616(-)
MLAFLQAITTCCRRSSSTDCAQRLDIGQLSSAVTVKEVPVDSLTKVPEDLYFDLLKAGESARNRGQYSYEVPRDYNRGPTKAAAFGEYGGKWKPRAVLVRRASLNTNSPPALPTLLRA